MYNWTLPLAELAQNATSSLRTDTVSRATVFHNGWEVGTGDIRCIQRHVNHSALNLWAERSWASGHLTTEEEGRKCHIATTFYVWDYMEQLKYIKIPFHWNSQACLYSIFFYIASKISWFNIFFLLCNAHFPLYFLYASIHEVLTYSWIYFTGNCMETHHFSCQLLNKHTLCLSLKMN